MKSKIKTFIHCSALAKQFQLAHLVLLVQFDALYQLFLHLEPVLAPNGQAAALGDVALARPNHLRTNFPLKFSCFFLL
jgi:hypothetical protein